MKKALIYYAFKLVIIDLSSVKNFAFFPFLKK